MIYRLWGWIIGIMLLGIIGSRVFIYSVPVNILSVMINKTLSQEDIEASSRQKMIRWSTALLKSKRDFATDIESFAMVPALIQGVASYREGDLQTAVSWFKQSTETTPYPKIQKRIVIPISTQINSDSSFTLDSRNLKWWRIRFDAKEDANPIHSRGESLVFSCAPNINSPNAVFEWSQPFDIPYHHTALIETRTDVGTILIFETVSNGKSTRHFIQTGTGEPAQIVLEFQEEQIDYIYIVVRKNKESIENRVCRTEIKSITFLLDRDVQ